MSPHLMTWIIAALATAGVILRPFNLPEAVWAVSGVILLLLPGLINLTDMFRGIAKGTDVYLFLVGMMLLAEIARINGLFDWLAAFATRRARGSAKKLFLLIYAVGIVVTMFLSNDATAVVLTPAVAAAVKTAKAENPLPYLLICAFIANAASFVLPISNPANLVIYHSQMPTLAVWLTRFMLPSILSVSITFAVLRWTQNQALTQNIAPDVQVPALSLAGKISAFGIFITAAVLVASSAFGIKLGPPTAIAGVLTAASVLIIDQKTPWPMIKGISWSVLLLVAALFVLVEALQRTGLINSVSSIMQSHAQNGPIATAWGAGIIIAIVSNFMNNLPAGLIAGTAVQTAHVSAHVTTAILIGVDIGPNLSVTGSLATILWLTALRREGLAVGAGTFLKLGAVIMPPALLFALAGSLL